MCQYQSVSLWYFDDNEEISRSSADGEYLICLLNLKPNLALFTLIAINSAVTSSTAPNSLKDMPFS